MRAVIQRVTEASVSIDGNIHASIPHGMMVLVAFEDNDDSVDIDWMCKKILNLRIFDDPAGVMNLSINDIHGELLLISQFTLFASTHKGNRPSYIRAAKPDISIPLYEMLKEKLHLFLGTKLKSGIFGAEMKVALINDGPVTIIIDSKIKE